MCPTQMGALVSCWRSSWSLVGSLQQQVCLPGPDLVPVPGEVAVLLTLGWPILTGGCKAWSETLHATRRRRAWVCLLQEGGRGAWRSTGGALVGTEGHPHTRWATLVFLRNWALPGIVLHWVAESVSLSGDHLFLSHGPPLPRVADLPHVVSLPCGILGLLPCLGDQCLGQTVSHMARSAGLTGG